MFIKVVSYVANFPLPEHRTLPHFAEIIGFSNCEHQDVDGKNIFHHLFIAITYSWCVYLILKQCFLLEAPKLFGDTRSTIY